MNKQELLEDHPKNVYRSSSCQDFVDQNTKEVKKNSCSNTKMFEHVLKASTRIGTDQMKRKLSFVHSSPRINQNTSRKQQRKVGNLHKSAFSSKQVSSSNDSLICRNAACRALLASDDTFCKRCSCCICHQFDDNKDPSLWLVCISDSHEADYCGMSCHVECALQHQRAGVANIGHSIQLDGSFCCAFCGKISGIIECWRKQLIIAKVARRVDVLCYRISLSYRLLQSTSRFKELHNLVEKAKVMLEKEVGPLNGVSLKMGRGIVSRLSVSGDVQKLCSLAVEKVDDWLDAYSHTGANHRDDCLPAACRFHFENVTSTSLVLVMKEAASASSDNVKGYNLWYYRSHEQPDLEEPAFCFLRNQKRFFISNLQPCTEYTFCVVSFTELGNLGHSQAKCFTRSIEIINRNSAATKLGENRKNLSLETCSFMSNEANKKLSSKFSIRDLGSIIEIASAQLDDDFPKFEDFDIRECCDGCTENHPDEEVNHLRVSRQLDLNVVGVPDLNAEATPQLDSCCYGEDNGCTSNHAAENDDDTFASNKDEVLRHNGSAAQQPGKMPDVESRGQLCDGQTSSVKEEACDDTSTVINWPALFSGRPSRLDDNYEHCVKIIRWLEHEGHILKEFREKFFTWFSLRATEQERRVVNAFIRALEDDPSSLADQLMDSFSEVIESKRPRNGFCTRLWH